MTGRLFYKPAMWVVMGLISVVPTGASALDGYWTADLSNDWGDGLHGDESNWYDSSQPDGKPVKVPNGTAFFGPNAVTQHVRITKGESIRNVVFTDGAKEYTFLVESGGSLTVSGAGINNESKVIQNVVADGPGALIKFTKNSQFCYGKKSTPMDLEAFEKARIIFKGDFDSPYDICHMSLENSKAIFKGRASSGYLSIEANEGSKVVFKNRSDASNSWINMDDYTSLIIDSKGPKKNYKFNAENIISFGNIHLNKTTVRTNGSFIVHLDSLLEIDFADSFRFGKVFSKEDVVTRGRLRVVGKEDLKRKTYTLLKSKTDRFHEFQDVIFTGFGNLNPEIVYTDRAVKLVIPE